ncbi:MAG: hypothetical protein JXR77_05865 [Lentisphaeria bacterium]|nr:hypothetical protein [Lentisphaeria bacterium]
MPPLETPLGLSLLMCDTIIEDKHTGKKTLVGLFDRVHARRFPCIHPFMCVYVSLTGARGRFSCEVLCRHQDNHTVAFSAKGQVELRDPRQVVDLVFRLGGVTFAKPEMYWLNFVVDDVPIMMRPLFVVEGGNTGKGAGPQDAAPEGGAKQP